MLLLNLANTESVQQANFMQSIKSIYTYPMSAYSEMLLLVSIHNTPFGNLSIDGDTAILLTLSWIFPFERN